MRERFGLFGGERQAPRLEGTGHFLRAFMDVARTCQWLRHRGRLPLLLPRSARDEGSWPLLGGSARCKPRSSAYSRLILKNQIERISMRLAPYRDNIEAETRLGVTDNTGIVNVALD